MMLLYDEKNYNPDWNRYIRKAVRAVILRGDKLVLVKSRREGFYKLPGGGIEEGGDAVGDACKGDEGGSRTADYTGHGA